MEQIAAGLDALAATDIAALGEQPLREQLLELVAVANRVHTELVRRVDGFDKRGMCAPDGFRTARAWLQACGRLSGVVAHRLVKTARLLRHLPKLATAAQTGQISPEHLQQVTRLVDQVNLPDLMPVDATLADAAQVLDPAAFNVVCQRVQAHLNPDGTDPNKDFEKRGLTLSPAQRMLTMRGQLDPEGGAALATALDALMTPPDDGDQRSPAQRRADALVELARRQLTAGTLPTVGGQRPQVGVLLYPQALSPRTLATLANTQRDLTTRQQLHDLISDAPPEHTTTSRTDTAGHATPPTSSEMPADPGKIGNPSAAADAGTALELAQAAEPSHHGQHTDAARLAEPISPADKPHPADKHPPAGKHRPPGRVGSTGQNSTANQNGPADTAGTAWARPGWADPPWLSWVGPVSPVVAQRIACDADIWRVILSPTTGQPLDVGRAHRLVPHWIRKALYARDRGCRWTGCTTPAEWTDAHHLDPWAEGGETRADRCLLLCRYHHGLVHEGGWAINLDPYTGHVHITRPGGTPYDLPHTRSHSWNGPTTRAAALAV